MECILAVTGQYSAGANIGLISGYVLSSSEIGIPPNATLTYSVELVKVEPPVEPENLTVTERITIA